MRSRRKRKLISGFSKTLPPRHVTDRIVPWAGLIAALAGGVWALTTWRLDVQVQRVEATLEFMVAHQERFAAEVGAYKDDIAEFKDAQDSVVLDARCAATKAAAKARKINSPDLASFDCSTLGVDAAQAQFEELAVNAGSWQGMRDDVRTELVARVSGLAASGKFAFIEAEIAFLHALANCVEAGNCDEEVAAALFYIPIVRVLNASCRPGGGELSQFDPRYVLANLVVQNQAFERMRAISGDQGQQNPFLCPETRRIADCSQARGRQNSSC